jgi:hypothetical protein
MIRRMIRMIPRSPITETVVICFCALLAGGCFSLARGQSVPASDNPSATPTIAEKQSSGPDKTSAENSPSQKPTKSRKVITNDDMDRAHVRPAQRTTSARKAGDSIPATGICDEECAYEARQQMGFGAEREGEWQIQLVAARRNLALDARWRQAYFELNQAAQLYCTFMNQQRAAVLPSGNNYQAAYERAERKQYAENMGRTLSEKLSNASAATNRLMEETRDLEPVRAAIMSVLASRPYHSCQSIDP